MAAVLIVKPSVFAAGTSASSTSRGTIADRVDVLTANAAACTPTRASSSTGLCSPASAWTSSPRVADHISSELASSSRRRSTASATAPPHSANTSSGSSAARPSSPTQVDERVRAYICTGTATAVNW